MEERSPSKELILVCHVLPVEFSRNTSTAKYSASWKYNKIGILLSHCRGTQNAFETIKYVGCPSIYVPEEERDEITQLLAPLNCVPVFLESSTAHEHYQGFCRGVLWPLFHNIIDVYSDAKIQSNSPTSRVRNSRSETQLAAKQWQAPESWNPLSQEDCWGSYCIVNRIFASKVVEQYHENAIIWIHNYELLMLPSYLSRKIPQATLALFLHVPFPSSEIFRSLAMREEILRAILCANHIGFLLFEYARHFLTCCKRLLGLSYASREGGSIGIEYNGRQIILTCSHMSTELDFLQAKLLHESSNMSWDLPQEAIVFSSVDTMQGLSGLMFKLLAFDRFLSQLYENYQNPSAVVLYQVCVELQYRPNDYTQTKQQVERMVESINAKWPEPVVYLKMVPSISLLERLALWKASTHFISSSVRSGMSSYSFEFCVTKDWMNSPSVLIMSEFSADARVLTGSLAINPWKTAQVVDALHQTIEMPHEEMNSRRQLNMKIIRHHTISNWSERLLSDIEQARVKTQQVSLKRLGFGFGHRVMQFRSEFMKLSEQYIISRYKNGKRRLLVFPCTVELKYIQALAQNRHNIVFIISSTGRNDLETKFTLPNLGLISDNGFYYRLPHQTEWQALSQMSMDWKRETKATIQVYADRTNGAIVDETNVSVLYDYSNSDPEFGELQANHLIRHLSDLLKEKGIEIIKRDRCVEILPCGVNKAAAITVLLNHSQRHDAMPDFVLYIGQDTSDECAMKHLKSCFPDPITCTIGEKPSDASFYVESAEEVNALAETLGIKLHEKSSATNETDRYQQAFATPLEFIAPECPMDCDAHAPTASIVPYSIELIQVLSVFGLGMYAGWKIRRYFK